MPLPFANEDEFQTWVIVMARERGYRAFFIPGWMYRLAMASMKRLRRSGRLWPDKGWPDLILVRGLPKPSLHIWELKTDKGRVQPEQASWLTDFQACGIDARIIRPKDREWITEALAA